MDPTDWGTSQDDDGDRRAVPWESYFHRDAVLFVIDAGAHMHVKNPDDDETPFMIAMRAAVRFMEIKLVNSPKDYVGVMLWNTDESRMLANTKNTFYPHTLEYAPLKQVNVPTTYDLQNIVACAYLFSYTQQWKSMQMLERRAFHLHRRCLLIRCY